MEKAKVLEKLIKDSGYSKRAFASKCGIPDSTLYTILRNGVDGASVNIVITICRTLGITVEQLDEMSKGVSYKNIEPTYEDMQQLIARNGNKLTTDEKMLLIKLLSEL